MSATLEAWLETHHDPAWKHKPYKAPALGKPKGAGKDREFANLVRQYQYGVTETIDRRTIREPVTLDDFITRKRQTAPAFKPWKLPAPRVTLTKLSANTRNAENARISRYIASRRAA